MKQLDRLKMIQMLVFAVISGLAMLSVAKGYATASVLGRLLWVALALNFFFIFLDFTMYAKQEKGYDQLKAAIESDPVSHIGNRYGVDELLDRYAGQEIPKDFACLAFQITNIREINEKHSRQAGNRAIRRFSRILKLAAADQAFVGRNGGNCYVAMFEQAKREDLEQYLERIRRQLEEEEQKPDGIAIHFAYGLCYHEEGITDAVEMLKKAEFRSQQEATV